MTARPSVGGFGGMTLVVKQHQRVAATDQLRPAPGEAVVAGRPGEHNVAFETGQPDGDRPRAMFVWLGPLTGLIRYEVERDTTAGVGPEMFEPGHRRISQ